jgi:uncharacterized protein YjbI with pentapeptide repeats
VAVARSACSQLSLPNRLVRAPYGSDCDLHGLDLSSKVFSGVVMERTDLTGTKIRGTEMSRADAREAKMAGVDLTDTNCYAANFDGADLRNAQFENAILSSASLNVLPALLRMRVTVSTSHTVHARTSGEPCCVTPIFPKAIRSDPDA